MVDLALGYCEKCQRFRRYVRQKAGGQSPYWCAACIRQETLEWVYAAYPLPKPEETP